MSVFGAKEDGADPNASFESGESYYVEEEENDVRRPKAKK
jgi:hypothetical protein